MKSCIIGGKFSKSLVIDIITGVISASARMTFLDRGDSFFRPSQNTSLSAGRRRNGKLHLASAQLSGEYCSTRALA